MTTGLARAILAIAIASLGERRREWAWAMQGEFDAAIADRKALSFALGCLVAAWREMPRQAEGRFLVANYAFTLGLVLPVAFLQLFHMVAMVLLAPQQGGSASLLAQHIMGNPYLVGSYVAAIPSLLVLWALLAFGHLRLAWSLLDRDWSRAGKMAAFNGAISVTLIFFTVVIFLEDAGAGWQAMATAIELGAIHALSTWHARLFADGPSARFA